MPHSLIAGITESGKTTLAKRLAKRYRDKGIETIVLDPLCDPDWHASHQTSNRAEFLDIVRRSRQCAIFVDESGDMIGHYNEEMFWLATRARHLGHNSHFITQRPAQLRPTVRDQCSVLFLFVVSHDDAKTLAREFNRPELNNANQLKQFEFFHVSRFGPISKIQL